MIASLAAVPGCGNRNGGAAAGDPSAPSVNFVRLDNPIQPTLLDGPITLSAAKNEWISFVVQCSNVPAPRRKHEYALKLSPLRSDTGNLLDMTTLELSAERIVSVPVDVNRASFVRHTGLTSGNQEMPRALLPMKQSENLVHLERASADDSPISANSTLVWIEFRLPPTVPAGRYHGKCSLVDTGTRRQTAIAGVDIQLNVYDFVLPDERNLSMVGRLDWNDLQRLYPTKFETLRPQLMRRDDEYSKPAVAVLDALVTLAQRHRAEVVVPRLQPLVKWQSSDRPPQVSWEGLDSILDPWLTGDAFADRTPLGYWPLPAVDHLESFELESRKQYWSEAASHFDGKGWLNRMPIFVDKRTPGRAGTVESLQLSADAAQILDAHSRLRLTLPLEDDQLQFASESGNPNLLDPSSTARLSTNAPSLVFTTPDQSWPQGVARPAHWLRTDLPGLLPYLGAGGDEFDVRLWAWLSYLRQASMILWGSPLPRTQSLDEPADPNDVVWFYPGEWFGVDQPVPTLQLKWLRTAQQDFEYLALAKARGEAIGAMLLARLITKPVELQPGQTADPTYGLLCGTSDPAAWASARQLIAESILMREPGQAADPAQRNEQSLKMLRWAEPIERPVLVARSTDWLADAPSAQQPGDWLNLKFGIDIYNASDFRPDQNLLQWTIVFPGWEVSPKPQTIDALPTFRVQRFHLNARYNLERMDDGSQRELEVMFTDGFHKRQTPLRVVLPVAASDRRRPGLAIDGRVDDWDITDAILHDQPLVRMLSRPVIHDKSLQWASTDSSIFTGWSDEQLFVAFDLAGASTERVLSTRNFVDYQLRRAWGEDLAGLLIQPVYADNTLGPVLHMVCKPTGHWIERKVDARSAVDPWQAFEGAGIRYMATMNPDSGQWTGEVAIPWDAIGDLSKGRPRFLRFNFTQHRHATGESATWAGPVDYGRDDAFTGILYIRELDTPGIGAAR